MLFLLSLQLIQMSLTRTIYSLYQTGNLQKPLDDYRNLSSGNIVLRSDQIAVPPGNNSGLNASRNTVLRVIRRLGCIAEACKQRDHFFPCKSHM